MSLVSDDVNSVEVGVKLNVKKTQLLLLGRGKGVWRLKQAEKRMDGKIKKRSGQLSIWEYCWMMSRNGMSRY